MTAGDECIALVIPAYRAQASVGEVVAGFRERVDLIVVVDDASADGTAEAVTGLGDDVIVLRHERNQGVGAAMKTGIAEALRRGADIVVKADADGQMDPEQFDALLRPLLAREADVTKGNRWHHGRELEAMPMLRRMGNLALGFLVRASSGAWRVFDPTNGYIAWRREALEAIDLGDAEDRYRFEVSMINLLTLRRAVIHDVPMPARYGPARSHLNPLAELPGFAVFLFVATWKRLWLQYFVYDFNAVSLFLVAGDLLTCFGVIFGGLHWYQSIATGIPATAGTVLLAALPTLLGFNLYVQAMVLDISRAPTEPLCRRAR